MALVGDNGAGKSTLIKSVAGIHPFDEGEVRFEGRRVSIHGPRDAAKLGIEVVYQDLALADNLDVVANMFLGRERTRVGVVLDESEHGALRARDARQPVRDHAAVGPPDRGRPVRGPATGRGRGEVGDVELEARDPRRAHRCPRRRADATGPRPRPPTRGARPRRGDHLPQPARRLRMRGSDHGPAAGAAGRPVRAVPDRPAGGRPRHHGGQAGARARDGRCRSGRAHDDRHGDRRRGRGRDGRLGDRAPGRRRALDRRRSPSRTTCAAAGMRSGAENSARCRSCSAWS